MENKRILKMLILILEIQRESLAEQKRMNTNQSSTESNPKLPQDLIDNFEVKALLKISHSTLYRLKQEKLINAIRIGKRDYYSRTEIQKAKEML